MSNLNHYERLGVDEDASFEAIQAAKVRLMREHEGDRKRVEEIEASYDAILMDRLRMRQEGKIKVPERIRFPERMAEAPPDFAPKPTQESPEWLQRFIDTPSRSDVLLPGGLMLGASLLSVSSPPMALALGTGLCFYFLNRKENKFGRAFLITLAALIVGISLGLGLAGLFATQLAGLNLSPDTFAAIATLILLWLVTSFLR